MSNFIKQEYVLFIAALTVVFFKSGGDSVLATELSSYEGMSLTVILFVVAMAAIFAVVRHSDALAIKLGDPYGTLILTLSVISLEVVMISSVMLTGDANPLLARDTMFAVVMAVLNGLVGITLLIGGMKHHTQDYNLDGLKSYLVVITPLAILCLVLPNFTAVDHSGSMSLALTITLVFASVVVYSVFLYIQTKSHTHFFIDDRHHDEHEFHGPMRSNLYHSIMLVAHLGVVILMAKSIAIPIDGAIAKLGAPQALGGLIVAILILAPEAVGAGKAALNNQLQRAMNLYFGSVLATIALTVPAVLLISQVLSEPIVLGLGSAEAVLLVTTLVMTGISFSSGKTNALTGTVHLILFIAYIILMFE
ncbi:calcium:proton antiporter [Vibrio inusitatus NBRC 102082]|uniref:Calcium:proton antiporter n=1 Tax=Vibrio inusitatus NBRC 102082 TaxID=1219070 RepID=A0A4Y3HUQ8_9VIBR|nr:calcium:proton antiporter [Vibrio inusitatus]GEA50788.1 calcium:proton antiporter [Vibrio inusitatus NBRC 102082]